MAENKISKWAKGMEFDTPKRIIITSFRKLCGADVPPSAKYLDKEGCLYRMVFQDMEHGAMERTFEIPFISFLYAMEAQRVKRGVEYLVQRKHEGKQWKWVFEPASGAASESPSLDGEMLG